MIKFLSKYRFRHWFKRLSVFCFDFVGNVLFFPAKSLFKKSIDLGHISRIVVIRLDHIGDVIMTQPAISALTEHFPNSEIDLVVSKEAYPLFKNWPGLHKVIVSENNWFSRKTARLEAIKEFVRLAFLLKRTKYDIGIDFRGDLRNVFLMFFSGITYRLGYNATGGDFLLWKNLGDSFGKHQVNANLDLLKFLEIKPNDHLRPFVFSDNEEKNVYKKFGELLSQTKNNRIVIHPGAGNIKKCWGFDKFNCLSKKMCNEINCQIVLIGTEEEKRKAPDLSFESERVFDLRGKTELSDLSIIFRNSKIFIGNDSGPAHLAAAEGMHIILISSGTNDISCWHPWTSKLSIIEGRGAGDSIESIPPEQVFEEVIKVQRQTGSYET